MTIQQAQNTIALIKQIELINLDKVIKEIYPNRTDLENITINQISVPDFLYLVKKVLKQFVNEFSERENTLILPLVYNHPQFGNAQIDSQLQNFTGYLNGGNIQAAENTILWLAGYQLEYGFYHKSIKKASEMSLSSLSRLSEKLGLIQSSIENRLNETKSLQKDLENSKNEIHVLINQKRDELNTITTNLSTSNTQAAQINQLLTKGTEQSSRLTTLLEQQEQNKISADKKLIELQGLYNKTNEELTTNIKTVIGQLDEFKKQVGLNQGHLNFVEGKREFFEERINYLQTLIGQEVGASLFKTFKQRKDELEKPVFIWAVAVPIMAILTILWVIFLFYNQPTITNVQLWWQAFAVNSLKSSPAVFLLIFTINQYRKERNFQEEYAFKSAVALTIDAYADRINDPNNKDRLIMESVLNVYKTPIEESRAEKIKTRTALDTMKSMVDVTKEIVKGTKQ